MTQMLLFDAVPENAAVVPAASAGTVPAADTVSSGPVGSSPGSLGSQARRAGGQLEREDRQGGVHHMGDLARLVLLRYDLVAKRRAEIAARRRTAAPQ